MPGPQLMELFGKDYDVWLCWRKFVTESGFEVSKDPSHSQCALSLCFRLELSNLPVAMPSLCHGIVNMESNLLKPKPQMKCSLL